MEFDDSAFIEIVREQGREVYSMSCDGGGPGSSYSEGIVKFAGHYYAYDDNGGFGGPYEDLDDALGVMGLSFGETRVTISVSGIAAATIAEILKSDAPAGQVIRINEKSWFLDDDGQFSRRKPRVPPVPETKEQKAEVGS